MSTNMDKLQYIDNEDGTFTKIVTPEVKRSIITAEQLPMEVLVLTTQLNALQTGQVTDPSEQADIDATVLNYQEALNTLPKQE